MIHTGNTVLPGRPWLYLKLYGTERVIERSLRSGVLRDTVQSLATDIGSVDWFFVRYHDSDSHLRLRLRQRMSATTSLQAAECIIATSIEIGFGRVALDTYVREVDRYGGEQCMDVAERVFCADSSFVCAALEAAEWASADDAWPTVMFGVKQILDAFYFDDAQKLACVVSAVQAFANEFNVDSTQEKQIGLQFRKRRASLEQYLTDDHVPVWNDAVGDAFAKREVALTDYVRTISSVPDERYAREAIARSIIHMFCNRLFAGRQRMNEFIALEFLRRLLVSTAARSSTGKSEPI